MGRIHLGSILGTTITLDVSFLILCALFVMMNLDTSGVQYALLWVLGIFGFGPSQILLQGVGGVTINERRARPWQDLFISAAGPASSILLAWGVAWIRGMPFGHRDPFLVALLPLLQIANIYWAIFNLMPVAPLDGHGMVRNFLRMFLNERLAFVIAIWISIIVGSLLALLSLALRQFFLLVLLLWYVRASYMQWQFFRSIDRTND
ncbi:MAG: hypothetical protein DMF59_10570 [Acidobacteria bacterium]|nr:MAG: hypothetical protein DMF59_10570 [Acidobacteriota bacterium]